MSVTRRVRLGINIDHVATVRNARGGTHPDPVRAALCALAAGADSITAHLREDRRHIRDHDIAGLRQVTDLKLNLEMAPTEEMQSFAVKARPFACCLVPERRQELTTEGGLDVVRLHNELPSYCQALRAAGSRVSLFVEPDRAQLDAAKAVGAHAVELHTGLYCEAVAAGGVEAGRSSLGRLADAASYGRMIGLEVHAGHGITYDSVGPIAAIPEIVELNIGHFLVGEALFVGFSQSIARMRFLIDEAAPAEGLS